ncbi:hypothetical protein FA15DRAFT_672188 [Coprinopsis marcescibilis]|uniref:Uncharacterized protein n=1 Tax=Coprinopsis marcescibilis TaxID=230819 RepID=A0A5C3KP00_COPMA|nr:hypothetical protein FA15DRAFT_672188 [Coprinopsis marcescibilis]
MSKLRKQPAAHPSPNGSPVKSVVSSARDLSRNLAKTQNESVLFEYKALTVGEQYWSARALKAEALLEVQATHHREVKTMNYSQEIKISRDMTLMKQQHEAKHALLEKVVVILLGAIVVLVLVIIYLATQQVHVSQSQRQCLVGMPSHFTIPILSPFTSVVEKNSSVIGTRVLALVVIVAGLLAFFVFRHWFNSRRPAH